MSGRLGRTLLVVGALAGLALAAWDLSRSPESTIASEPEVDVIATVNGQPIGRAALHRSLRNVASERRQTPLDAAARRFILDRLIDEELLIQAGLEMGLAGRDPGLRAALSAATIDLVTALPQDENPTDAQLQALYGKRADRFRTKDRLQVQIGDFSAGEEGAEMARQARIHWQQGQAPPATTVPLPAEPITAAELERLAGPTLTRAALALADGEISEPVRGGRGWHLLRVQRRVPGQALTLDQARPALLDAWRKEAAERKLRAFLQARREASDVQVLAAP